MEANVQTLKNFIDDRCAALSTGLVDCYDLVGPFNITVDVQPANAGNVKVNSMWLPYYAWNGDYFGNIDTYFKASPNTNYVFDHWEAKNHVFIYPQSTVDTLDIFTSDTIIAHFKFIEPDPPIDTTPPPPVVVDPPVGFTGFHMPNGFSPNGDGNNELLKFFVGTDVNSFHLLIFDRWGNLMFETENEYVLWDGTYKGMPLNTGVYAYALTYVLSTGQEVKKTGNITLIK